MSAETIERDAFSVSEFCKRHSICRGSFYNLLAAGQAPRTFKAGTRTLISKEAATEWRRAREQATSSGRAAVRA